MYCIYNIIYYSREISASSAELFLGGPLFNLSITNIRIEYGGLNIIIKQQEYYTVYMFHYVESVYFC